MRKISKNAKISKKKRSVWIYIVLLIATLILESGAVTLIILLERTNLEDEFIYPLIMFVTISLTFLLGSIAVLIVIRLFKLYKMQKENTINE